MVKKSVIILSAMLWGITLTACSGGEAFLDSSQSQNAEGQSAGNSGAENPGEDSLGAKNPDADIPDGTKTTDARTDRALKMYVSKDGLRNSPYALSDSGCYELFMNDDWSANILYTDMATMQRIYLSSDLSSDHHSEADTSYIKNVMGGACVFVIEDGLYIVTMGYEDTPGALYRADLNGENRKKLLTFDTFEPFSEGIASDGDFLYTLSSDDMLTKSIVRLDLENGSLEELYELPEYSAFLMSAYDDCMIIKTISMPASGDFTDDMERYQNQEHILYRYSLNEGTMEELMRWNQDQIMEICKDDQLYFFDRSDDSLKNMDMKSGEIHTLARPMAKKGAAVENISNILSVYDQHLLFDCLDGRRFNMDIETMDVKEQTYDPGYRGGPGIVGEYEAAFLITADELEIPVHTYAPDGVTPIVNIHGVPNLALISKEDYWNSNYEFERIRNTFYEE